MKPINRLHPAITGRENKKSIQFSVVVPFLNEQNHIERCVRALLNQDFDKDQYEIIFIDNGSTDGSGEIVRRYAEIEPLRCVQPYSLAPRSVSPELVTPILIRITVVADPPDYVQTPVVVLTAVVVSYVDVG